MERLKVAAAGVVTMLGSLSAGELAHAESAAPAEEPMSEVTEDSSSEDLDASTTVLLVAGGTCIIAALGLAYRSDLKAIRENRKKTAR